MISCGVLRGCSFQSSVSILLPMTSVALVLDGHDGCGLVVGLGLFVDVVGRTEIERLHVELAGEEALGELDLEIERLRRDFADVGMGVGVIANLVALAHEPLHQADVLGGLCAYEKECPFHIFLLEDVEDLRRPLRVGSVVEGNGNFVGMIAVVLHRVVARIDIHVLVDDELLARIGLIGIDGHGALAGLRQSRNAHDVALALDVDVVAGLQRA